MMKETNTRLESTVDIELGEAENEMDEILLDFPMQEKQTKTKWATKILLTAICILCLIGGTAGLVLSGILTQTEPAYGALAIILVAIVMLNCLIGFASLLVRERRTQLILTITFVAVLIPYTMYTGYFFFAMILFGSGQLLGVSFLIVLFQLVAGFVRLFELKQVQI
jgi:hypothetical protein